MPLFFQILLLLTSSYIFYHCHFWQCSVAQKTVSVTADVVGHKYGESAGKLVNDTGESAGNIVRTITHVSMLSSGKTFTKSVAKNTGKTNVLQGKDDVNPKIDDQ
jgi:hypothetical protein